MQDMLFLVALIAAPLASPLLIWLFLTRSTRRFVLMATVLLLLISCNPICQFVLLESIDTWRGKQMERKFRSARLNGKDSHAVIATFGRPDYTWVMQDGSDLWGFKQLPGYWFGSCFQATFKNGRVDWREANDD